MADLVILHMVSDNEIDFEPELQTRWSNCYKIDIPMASLQTDDVLTALAQMEEQILAAHEAGKI